MPDLGDDYPDTLLWQYIAAAGSLDGDLDSPHLMGIVPTKAMIVLASGLRRPP